MTPPHVGWKVNGFRCPIVEIEVQRLLATSEPGPAIRAQITLGPPEPAVETQDQPIDPVKPGQVVVWRYNAVLLWRGNVVEVRENQLVVEPLFNLLFDWPMVDAEAGYLVRPPQICLELV